MWVYLAVILGALAVSCNAQERSPCPGLFRYVSQKPGQWDGEVTLFSDSGLHGVWARFILDGPSKEFIVADNFGEVVTTDHVEYLLKNRNYFLKKDEPVKVQISVRYEGDKAPSLIGFRLNARAVCLEHGGQYHWVEGGNQSSQEFFLGDLNNKDFLNTRPKAGSVTSCGTVPLHKKGKGEGEGQWPWHASIYLTKGETKKSVCSATLISPSHLVTAAHCVTAKNSVQHLHSDAIKIELGHYYTQSENKGLQEAHVAEITVHPGYNAINLDNDVAVIRLEKAITITDYVRPICLWEESPDVQSVLRREGIVTGLGFDNNGRVTDRMTEAAIRVEPRDVCLKSKPQLVSFLNDNNLCATYGKILTVCVGESGSGFSVLSDSPQPVWELRGLVSIGAGLQNNFICDESNYIVLTDLAKHLQWIKATLV